MYKKFYSNLKLLLLSPILSKSFEKRSLHLLHYYTTCTLTSQAFLAMLLLEKSNSKSLSNLKQQGEPNQT